MTAFALPAPAAQPVFPRNDAGRGRAMGRICRAGGGGMTDPFGHHSAHTSGAFIDAWGRGPMLVRFQGKEWWFEFSQMFGPQLLRKTDLEPLASQPDSAAHPFWKAFSAWDKAGRKHRAVRTKAGKLKFYLCHAPYKDERCR